MEKIKQFKSIPIYLHKIHITLNYKYTYTMINVKSNFYKVDWKLNMDVRVRTEERVVMDKQGHLHLRVPPRAIYGQRFAGQVRESAD